MAINMTQITITVPQETVQFLEELKQKEFCNKPYSEMYRHILDTGISVAKAGGKEQQKCQAQH